MVELDPLKQQEQMDCSNPQKSRKKSSWAAIGCTFAGVIAAFGILGIILFFSFVGRCTSEFSDNMDKFVKFTNSIKELSDMGIEVKEGDAVYSLGKAYFDEEKYDEAITWFSEASEMGHDDATYHLGLCYKDGLGVEKDADKSMEYFRLAAEQGSSEAQAEVNNYEFQKDIDETLENIEGLAEDSNEVINTELSQIKDIGEEHIENIKSQIPDIEEAASDLGFDIDLSGLF
jgi:TPR repeat protein